MNKLRIIEQLYHYKISLSITVLYFCHISQNIKDKIVLPLEKGESMLYNKKKLKFIRHGGERKDNEGIQKNWRIDVGR